MFVKRNDFKANKNVEIFFKFKFEEEKFFFIENRKKKRRNHIEERNVVRTVVCVCHMGNIVCTTAR